MSKRRTYLGQLKFDPNLLNGWVAKYLGNIRLTALLVLGMIGFGVFGYTQLSQRLNPEVDIAIVTVITTLPGAAPTDVEQLLTIPLEQELKSLQGLDTITSTSRESLSAITLQFLSTVPRELARQRAQEAVDMVSNLPEEATDPRVSAIDFEDVPVWQFALTADQDAASMARAADDIQLQLENLPQVDRVEISGVEKQEVQIIISPEQVVSLRVQPQQLAEALRTATNSLPAGSVTTGKAVYTVRIDPSIVSLDDIRGLPVTLQQNEYQLGEIARVQWATAPEQQRTYLAEQGSELEQAVQISVFKRSTADIVQTQQVAAVKAAEVLENYPTLVLHEVENVAAQISEQFADLRSNFATTIGLVFLTLFVFLGIRQALVVALSIPLTFLVAFGIMQVTGQSLNFLTLFSLLLALGLLVDDAIVAVSSITAYYRSGKFTPLEAGLLVWRDFIVPIFTTTLTTVWAFLPLLLSTGIIGEFIQPIPIVVSSTLLTSTTVAMFVALPFMILLLRLTIPRRVVMMMVIFLAAILLGSLVVLTRSLPFWWLSVLIAGTLVFVLWKYQAEVRSALMPYWRRVLSHSVGQWGRKSLSTGVINLERFEEQFGQYIFRVLSSRSLQWRIVIAVIAFAVFAYSLLPLGVVQNVFFPKTDTTSLYVGLRMPAGSAVSQTELVTLSALRNIADVPELELAVAEVGAAPVSGMGGGGRSSATANITLRLKDEHERERTASEIGDDLRATLENSLANVRVTVFVPSGGPPVGSDIALKISGPDLAELERVALQVESYLENQEGVVNVERSILPGRSQMAFQPNEVRLQDAGLSNTQVQFWLRTALSGFELAEVNLDDDADKESVKLYFSPRLITPEELGLISIPTSEFTFPLLSLGELKLTPSPSQIVREEGDRTITVSASVLPGYSGPEVNQELLSFTETISLPYGYGFGTGGANEENARSVQAILMAMLLSFILILATMVIQLGSFRQAFVVMLVIPLAVSGVFVLFALTGTPLSFPALIGVLALFGIVVNNSIVLVDKMNQGVRVGLPLQAAISDAVASRLEPILFSSLTTIIGLIPITLSDPLWQGLGGAIIAGLSVSGIIMLLFIPVVYWWIFQDRSSVRKAVS